MARAGTSTRQLGNVIARRLIFANAIAALLVATYIELSEPTREGFSLVARLAGSLGVTSVSVALISAFGLWRWRRDFEPSWLWREEGRPPTPAEQAEALDRPWDMTVRLFRYWTVAAAVIGLAFLITPEPRPAAMAAVATLLGGLTASALSFMLMERALRPAIADALGGQPAITGRAPGIRRRLLLAWGLGSGIPLAGLAVTPVLRDPTADVPLGAIVTFLACAGLAAGAVTTRIASRTIGDPLEAVRLGLGRVQAGDLDVAVAVDDGGEIGLLEAGFNRMVDGLRERQQLEDLFGRYVGDDVARHALEHGVELGGEVREVSVLFVDVVGSTALAESQAPAEVVELLNRFFGAVVRVAEAERGWINKFEGDAALCVFGAPADETEHAARALRAARALCDQLDVDVGIGVSSGEVVAGNVGAEHRHEYTVIGQPVNEAARLTEVAKQRPSRVLASRAAVKAAGDEASHWHRAGTVELRGIAEPVEVYEPCLEHRIAT